MTNMGPSDRLCSAAMVFLCVLVAVNASMESSLPKDDVVSPCTEVKPIFEMNNLTDIPDTPISGAGLSVCSSQLSCCTQEMEDSLRLLVRRDFQSLLQHNSRSLQGLLATTAATIQDHVTDLVRQSENKSLALFGQLFKYMALQVREPIVALYDDLALHVATPKPPSVDASVSTFFSRLFPLAYHHAINPNMRDFAADYKTCLRETLVELSPFGDVPHQLSRSLSRSLEAARVLLEALRLGAEVLNTTDSLLTGDAGVVTPAQAQCHTALLRMSYCSRCAGLRRVAKPCAGLCLNVLRGCLTQHAAELDLPWNGFVEATERLVIAVQGPDAVDDVLRSLNSKITEAIMLAIENGPQLEKKVKRACGQHQWVDREETPTSDGKRLASGQQEVLGVTLTHGHLSTGQDRLASKLRHFVTSLTRSRGFYANLAESLCSDESFAETRDTADCWNGQRVGEYTKTVVASSVTAQKYNPELTWTPRNPDPRIAQLSDKLRHIKQVVVSQLVETPPSLSYLRDDEGSGSGEQPVASWNSDDGTDWDGEEGSGSGNGAIDQGTSNGVKLNVPPHAGTTKNSEENTPPSHGSRSTQDTCLLFVVLAVLCSRHLLG